MYVTRKYRFLSMAVGVAFLAAAVSAQAAVSINEIRIDDGGSDTDEYIELAGDPNESLTGLTILYIGDGSVNDPNGCVDNCRSGVIERVLDLTGEVIPTDGYWLAANATLGTDISFSDTIDVILFSNYFENSDNTTALLVSGFSGAANDDLDTDNDGVLDSTPWTSVIDALGLVEDLTPTGATNEVVPYAAGLGFTNLGPDGAFVPAHGFRSNNGPTWLIGSFGGDFDTPGVSNVPEPASLVLMLVGLAGMLTRRRM